MPSNVKFVGAFIRKAEIKGGDVGAVVSIHMTSSLTEDILKAMEWDDPDDTSTKLEKSGDLAGGNLILTPAAEMLQKHEIQFGFSGADKFVIITKEKKDSVTRELRFVIHSTAVEATTSVFEYINKLKKEKGTLQLSYTPQDNLPI